MAYNPLLSVADIQKFYPRVKFSEETEPNLYEVETWIAEATALIYAAIADTYQIPVTDPDDRTILRIPARSYVKQHVNYVLGRNRINIMDKTKRSSQSSEVDLTYFGNYIEDLKKGGIKLVNTPETTTQKIGQSYNSENGISPVFESRESVW